MASPGTAVVDNESHANRMARLTRVAQVCAAPSTLSACVLGCRYTLTVVGGSNERATWKSKRTPASGEY